MIYPKLSIVTLSYNQGEYLEQTILSVLNQEYPNLEYIIIDGGSTDNSIEIIKKYEHKLAYWVSEKDNGMYDGIQKGFEKSTGEIMAWINSDDCFHAKSFFVVSEIFTQLQKIEWLQGTPSVIDESGRIVTVYDYRRWTLYDFLTNDKHFIQQESCFWKRSLWERAGGKLDISLKYAGDFALWLSFFDFAELYCTNTILGGFRMRSKNQLSIEKLNEYKAEAKKLITKRKDNLEIWDWINLMILSGYQNFISHIPILKLIFYIIFIEKMYPPKISFNRASQQFMMSETLMKKIYDYLKSYTKEKIRWLN